MSPLESLTSRLPLVFAGVIEVTEEGPSEVDSDNDGTPDSSDGCPNDPNKVAAGTCGCGVADTDSDNDSTPDCNDDCPDDSAKVAAGVCGCGVADTDSDNDGTPNCNDDCPDDATRTVDADDDNDGFPNCVDLCPADPLKQAPGTCDCGIADTDRVTDTDGDGVVDCDDLCDNDRLKSSPGTCGCGTSDSAFNTADFDGDGVVNCIDTCPYVANGGPAGQSKDADGDGIGDLCDGNCPGSYSFYDGKCFGLPTSGVENENRQVCPNGGTLASIQSAKQNAVVLAYCKQANFQVTTYNCYIGLSDQGSSNDYYWLDSSSASYANTVTIQGTNNIFRNCVVMRAATGVWETEACGQDNRGVCTT